MHSQWPALGMLALGCGGETTKIPPVEIQGSGGQSGDLPCSGETLVGCAGESTDRGVSAEPFCTTETKVAAPTVSTNCVVSARDVDPVFICGRPECAVKRGLDLECESSPTEPSLSATDDGAVLMAIADDAAGMALARLMTVDDATARVDDVPELADPNVTRPDTSIRSGTMTTSSHGMKWLFSGSEAPLTALRETHAGWMRSRILAPRSPEDGALLGDVHIVDDQLGFVSYASEAPHLVTWDGSCWSDRAVGDASSLGAMALAVDEQRRPWLAWFSPSPQLLSPGSLFVRSPTGATEDVLAGLTPDGSGAMNVWEAFRLLPGGFDGTAAAPLVAARNESGVVLFSRSSALDPEWDSTLLPEPIDSSELGAYCPVGDVTYTTNDDPCSGLTSCDAQWSAVSSGFDLVRTQSGGTFAAWVVYSSNGSYVLESKCVGGQLPHCACISSGASGTGTAELVVMRLSALESVPSRFRFDMGGPILDANRELVMAARGDTILVAAQLGGIDEPTLSYLEVDASSLP